METIGLIVAMNQERDALLRLGKGWKRIRMGKFTGHSLQTKGRKCILITTGWGRKRAAEATQVLLEEAKPQMLISFGIAGAVHADLQIGDVVISSKSCVLEHGLPGETRQLSTLSETAWKAAAEALQPDKAQILVGTTITTHGSQVILDEGNEILHPVLEMETAGIARVAAEQKVPLVSIRSISDGPQAPIPIDLEAAMGGNDNLRIDKLIMMTLRNPKILFQSGQMMKNSRIAEDHAALVLWAVLNEPGAIS